uniref:Uncharacterized protein n=1 Tax=Aegilops tauschii subsp. strangulata TaxID=200361 RepID=A0A453SMR3_AEGTS
PRPPPPPLSRPNYLPLQPQPPIFSRSNHLLLHPSPPPPLFRPNNLLLHPLPPPPLFRPNNLLLHRNHEHSLDLTIFSSTHCCHHHSLDMFALIIVIHRLCFPLSSDMWYSKAPTQCTIRVFPTNHSRCPNIRPCSIYISN